jgi:hypothetical protein
MKKVVATVCIAMAITFLVSGTTDSLAQGKKKSGGTIEIIHSKDGKYRFSIRDADGKYIAGSAVGHETEAETKAVVEELKKVLPTAVYVSKKSSDTKTDKGK